MPAPFFADGEHTAFLPEVVALVASCVVILFVCQRLRLVPIVAFLLTGVLIGPNALGLIRDSGRVETLAEVGVMLLLFTIGMEFSLDELLRMVRLILIAGGLQVGVTVALAVAALAYFGVSWQAGVFTGCLVALSSDALVMKILADRDGMGTPAGRATIAILVFQDLAAVAMILLVPMLAGKGGSPLAVAWALAKAVGTIAVVLVVARWLLPRLLEVVARTCLPELFLLTVTAICFGTAWLTSLAGVDLALGAFLAGLVLSGSRLKDLAFGEMLPMRTLFSAAFFVSLGMLLDPRFVLTHPMLVLGAVALILGLRLVATALGLAVLGTPPNVILVSTLLLSQVGEFSFVLQRAGLAAGLSPAGLGETGGQAFIAASVLMMALTPFFAQAGWWLEGRLRRRAKADPTGESGGHGVALEGHLVIAGYGVAARPLARMLHAAGVPFGILTLNPDGAAEAEREGFLVRLGDSSRAHGLQLMVVERAKMLVCADDDPATTRRVAAVARTLNPTLAIVVRTAGVSAVDALLEAGADQVIAEEMEGVVQLFVRVLDGYLVPRDEVARHVETLRSEGYSAIRPGTTKRLALVCSGLDGECLDTRRVLIRAGSVIVGLSLDAAGLSERFGLEVTEAQRHDEVTHDPDGDWIVTVGDRLVLRGSAAQFAAAADQFRRPGGAEPVRPDSTAAVGTIEPPAGRCPHSDQVHAVTPQTVGCEECLALGQRWVHLRVCMTCGHVGCCDSSKGKHATAHYKESGHPIIRSLEPGETWGWCYVDEVTL
jgi:monovalent cation:H+ antiporter-2, CPA2 family